MENCVVCNQKFKTVHYDGNRAISSPHPCPSFVLSACLPACKQDTWETDRQPVNEWNCT